jgi:tRNA uridine 5-carbamoylmethylation protein Kti12
MKIKILIMGLPGSGKTTIAKFVVKLLKAEWLNADKIRGRYKDWDFSRKGIIRQVKRMKNLARKSRKKIIVADFVCPYQQQVKIFRPNFIIWMDTIKKGRLPTFDKTFQKPKRYDIRIKKKNLTTNKSVIKNKLKKIKN